MNKPLLALALALGGAISASAGAADISVSVRVGEPGFYGQLDIGGFPQPRLLYAQPVLIERAPPGRAPIYLRVPPGHAKNWSKHCRAYDACGERVYFVREDWYEREYAPRYQQRHGDERRPEHAAQRDDHRAEQGHDQRDDRPQDKRGHGSDKKNRGSDR